MRSLLLSVATLLVVSCVVSTNKHFSKARLKGHYKINMPEPRHEKHEEVPNTSQERTKLKDRKSVISFCQTLECLQILQALEREMNNQSMGVYSGRW